MKLENKKPILLMVPFPAQGHVTPMLNLASSFSKLDGFNFLPLIVLPEFIYRQVTQSSSFFDHSTGLWNDQLMIVSIPAADTGYCQEVENQWDFFRIVNAMENQMPIHLKKLIQRLRESPDFHVAGVIVDLLASWAIPVARECGIATVAGFWPASLAAYHMVQAIPDMIKSGFITESGLPLRTHEEKTEGRQQISFYTNQPFITSDDLLWSIGTLTQRLTRFKFWIKTMDRSRTLHRLLVNSFPYELLQHSNTSKDNKKWANSSTTNPTSRQKGPTTYSVAMLQQAYTLSTPRLSFWSEDTTCLNWLDQHPPKSVVYVSFGSWFGPPNKDKVTRLAFALESCNRPFLWALGPNWRDGLPNGYVDRISTNYHGGMGMGMGMGMVVAWAPQMEVLNHQAVGCFFTHCGWNSTMESIMCGKPMLCHPIAGDQPLNCKYITSVWRIGVTIDNDLGIEAALDKVMSDDEMKRRVDIIKERVMGQKARLRMADDLVSVAQDFFMDHHR